MNHHIRLLLFIFPLSFHCYGESILIIESYHAEYAWDKEYIKGITDNLEGEHTFSFFQMDTKRLPVSEHKKMAELAWQKYLNIKPDIVVLGDDNALKYLGPKLKYTKTPVIYLGINNNPRRYDIFGARNITGVLERPLLKRSIIYLSKIFEEVDKVLVLFDSSPSSRGAISTEFKSSNVLKLGTVSVEVDQIAQWQKKVITARQNDIDYIRVGIYQTMVDEQGNHVPAKEVMAWTNANSDIPIFCFWKFSIGEGKAIGGLVIEGYQQGYTAAMIINKIIAGEDIASIRPQVAEKGRYIFSRAEIARHQLTIPEEMKGTIIWTK